MKKTNTLFILAFMTIFVTGCSKKNGPIEKAGWLIGNWENVTPQSDFREIWARKNDSVFSGKSFVTVSKDTVFNESMELLQRNDSLFYVVTVKGQNNEKPVAFYLTTASGKELVFENPKHDFPTKITYAKITNDSLVASVSGIQNGKEARESFPMKRSK